GPSAGNRITMSLRRDAAPDCGGWVSALDDREAGGPAGAPLGGGGVDGGDLELVAPGLELLGLRDAALEAHRVLAAMAGEREGAGEHQPGALLGRAVLVGGRHALLLDLAAGLGREELEPDLGGAAER